MEADFVAAVQAVQEKLSRKHKGHYRMHMNSGKTVREKLHPKHEWHHHEIAECWNYLMTFAKARYYEAN